MWVLVFLAGFRRSFWSSGRQVEREENIFFLMPSHVFVSVDGFLLAERQLVVSSCRLAADSWDESDGCV